MTLSSWKTPVVFATVGLSGLITSGVALNSLLSVPVSETVEQRQQREEIPKNCMGALIVFNITILVVLLWYLVWRLRFSQSNSGCVLITEICPAHNPGFLTFLPMSLTQRDQKRTNQQILCTRRRRHARSQKRLSRLTPKEADAMNMKRRNQHKSHPTWHLTMNR